MCGMKVMRSARDAREARNAFSRTLMEWTHWYRWKSRFVFNSPGFLKMVRRPVALIIEWVPVDS